MEVPVLVPVSDVSVPSAAYEVVSVASVASVAVVPVVWAVWVVAVWVAAVVAVVAVVSFSVVAVVFSVSLVVSLLPRSSVSSEESKPPLAARAKPKWKRRGAAASGTRDIMD